jgi:hypothetical protein
MENEKRTDRNSWAELDENRLSDILTASQIKATDTYETPPQIIWIDNSTIATLGNFSASTGKAKAKKTFNVSAIVAASLAGRQVLNYRAHLPEGKRRILYVDTEQSRFHCHNVLERILRLAGLPTTTDNENLDFICLREYTPAVRIGVIDYALRQNKGYGLVIIETPPQIIWIDNSTIATLGNFSASTGKAKAKKTFNVSAIVAASLAGRQVLNYRAHLPEGKRRILYVDTEQSRFHCHNVLERILRLAGLPTTTDNENLDFICLREYTPAVRIGVIDYALRQNKGYGLVIIDGIRDLMLDINSTSESVEVINKMMEWSSKYDLHIHCVLHLNKGDNNVRGHIGTEMSNKAETVLVITKSAENPVISEVHALHIREKEFKPFAFSVDDEGLPVMVDNYSFDGSVRPKARSSFMDLSIEQHREALSAAFGDRPIKGFENVLQALMASYEAIGFKRGRSVMIKLLQYLTENLKLIVKRDKLFYYDVTPTEALLFDEECEEAEGEK